jgi:hypothetical protein
VGFDLWATGLNSWFTVYLLPCSRLVVENVSFSDHNDIEMSPITDSF